MCGFWARSHFSREHHNMLQKQTEKKKTKRYVKKTKSEYVRHSGKTMRDQGPTNRPGYISYQRLHIVWTHEFSTEIRRKHHGASRPDPHKTRTLRYLTGQSCWTIQVHGCSAQRLARGRRWVESIINRITGCRLIHGDRSHDIRSATIRRRGETNVDCTFVKVYIIELQRQRGLLPHRHIFGVRDPKITFTYQFNVPFRETMSFTASPKMLPVHTTIVNQTCPQA